MNSLGTVNCDLDQYDEAEKNFCESVALYKKLNGDKHSSVADKYNNLGIVKRKKGEFEKAIKHYESAYQIKEQIFGENNLGGAVILQNIAIAHKKLKNMIKLSNILKVHCKSKNYYVEIAVQSFVQLMIIWREFIMKNSSLIWQSHSIQLLLKSIGTLIVQLIEII
ncbi:unnamed protein product [Paramecium octaurelia]|uniref:Uncharacterized protein n=1 Tax=Paramecium octaurelia TaxID=43137 RepID=A0A8S1TZD5_PAROT|nr:unnamed protein product [Paramecium octaurelia]